MYKLFLKTGKCMNILTRLQVSSFLFVLTVMNESTDHKIIGAF